MENLKETALCADHIALGARMVPFAGYNMPVQYEGIIKEHEAVRNNVGLFDVSHMGVSVFKGKDIHLWVNDIITKDVSNLEVGHGAYSCLCHETGGTVDDLIVYRKSEDEMLLVFNASNKEKDFNFFTSLPHNGMALSPADETLSLLALQGPHTPLLLGKMGFDKPWPKMFTILDAVLGSCPVTLLFTGYTGERGCEVIVKNKDASLIWKSLLENGREFGITPCGLGARDTLRLEMGFSLYGHELSDDISPVEAGISWCIGWKKPNFVGREALLKQKENPPRKMLALKVAGRQAPRQDMSILDASGAAVGKVTSGTFSPSLGVGICLALVDSSAKGPYKVELRAKTLDAEEVKRPFLTKES